MSMLVPTDRSIRVAAGVAAMLFALTMSAQSRPLGPQVPDTDQRGQIVTPKPPVKSSYDPKTSIVCEFAHAVIARSEATKQSIPFVARWIASLRSQ
jgi:hypothetical protein